MEGGVEPPHSRLRDSAHSGRAACVTSIGSSIGKLYLGVLRLDAAPIKARLSFDDEKHIRREGDLQVVGFEKLASVFALEWRAVSGHRTPGLEVVEHTDERETEAVDRFHLRWCCRAFKPRGGTPAVLVRDFHEVVLDRVRVHVMQPCEVRSFDR
jgi:hypothetical protein